MRQIYFTWKAVIASLALVCLTFLSSSTILAQAGSISASQTLCSGDSPSALIETVAPTIPTPWEYLWMEATPGNAWTEIPSATGISYTPPAITTTTNYIRCVRTVGTTDYIETNAVTITVVPNSIANIDTAPSSGNVNNSLFFAATTSANSTYVWDWGDGTPTSSGQNAIHTYAPNGNFSTSYTVTLTVTNNNNCITTTSTTVVIEDIALPIDLISFDATITDGGVQLRWVTASEENNEYFQIERSDDGISFEVIARIEGAGFSDEWLEYAYRDELPTLGQNYYRLKQVDFDGKFEYSDIVAVKVTEGVEVFSFYPNPCRDELNLKVNTTLKDGSYLQIMNLYGQLVNRINIPEDTTSNFTIDLSQLDSGTYVIMLNDTQENLVLEKIMKF
ncbi:MAG: T9SS type A sorting domain-containing protein [Bacteroidota bacterium]